MAKRTIISAAGFAMLLAGLACHHHDHDYDYSDDRHDDRNSVHVRAPYTNINVHWDKADDDEDEKDIRVDVDD